MPGSAALLLLHLAGGLALELLIEGEDSALTVVVNVAGTTATRGETSVGVEGKTVLEARGGTCGILAAGGLGSFEGVASAAAAGVGVVVGGDGWVRLGDTVGHVLWCFDIGCLFLKVVFVWWFIQLW